MESNSKIYTIEDYLKFKDKIYKHCLFLEKNDIDKAEELYSETTYSALIYLKDKTFTSDKHFINTMGRISYNILLNRKKLAKSKPVYYLEELIVHDNDGEEDSIQAYEIPDPPRVFNSYENNIDIHYLTSGLTYFKKKIFYELYLGFSKQELVEKYKIAYSFFTRNFENLNFEKFMGPKPEKVVSAHTALKRDILQYIDNDKHKKMYEMYLDKVPFEKIAASFKTSKSAIGVTINRINKNLKQHGYEINRRGQGAKGGFKV